MVLSSLGRGGASPASDEESILHLMRAMLCTHRGRNLSLDTRPPGATCMLGLWGAILRQLTDRAMGVGCGPVRIRPRRGGERSSWPPATSSWRRIARGGGRRGAVENFPGMDDETRLVSGRPCATEACELVPETGPPPSSSMPWSIQGQRACIRKSGRRWLRVRGPGHTL